MSISDRLSKYAGTNNPISSIKNIVKAYKQDAADSKSNTSDTAESTSNTKEKYFSNTYINQTMINKYTIGQRPIEFLIKIKIADNKHNPKTLDLTGYTALRIQFRKPDGTVFTKDALPKDTANLLDTEIEVLE